MPETQRIAALDWVRNIAILILILYHTGMIFVPWAFHIKNAEVSELFVWWMSPMHDVRMPLLFLVSGYVSQLVLLRKPSGTFAKDRLQRLGIPLLASFFIFIPPQLWVERTVNGVDYDSLWQFYRTIFEFTPYPNGNFSWHHLWFLAYVLVYGLLLAWQHPRLSQINIVRPGRWLLVGAILLWIIDLWLFPIFPPTMALVGDWANLLFYGTIFSAGALMATQANLVEFIGQQRRLWLGLTAALLAYRYLTWFWPSEQISLDGLFTATAVLAITGYALAYLTSSPRLLRWFNDRSYCVYILHQTLLLVLAYWVLPLEWSISLKFGFLAAATLGLSLLGYELVRPFKRLHLLFGISTSK